MISSSFLEVFFFIRLSGLCPRADPRSYGINIVTSGWMQRNLIKGTVSALRLDAPQDLEWF